MPEQETFRNCPKSRRNRHSTQGSGKASYRNAETRRAAVSLGLGRLATGARAQAEERCTGGLERTEPGTGPPQPHTGPRPAEPPQGAGPCPGGGEGMPQRGRRDSGGGASRGLSKCLRGHPWRSRAKNLPADAEAQVQPLAREDSMTQ